MNIILSKLHNLMRRDPYIMAMTDAISEELIKVADAVEDIESQNYFDTITWRIDDEVRTLGIKVPKDIDINGVRSIISARWKNNGKSDIELLNAIANSWDKNNISVTFTNGEIQIQFAENYGEPNYIYDFKEELERAKPAHLPILFLYKYYLIEEVDKIMLLEEIKNLTLDKFKF